MPHTHTTFTWRSCAIINVDITKYSHLQNIAIFPSFKEHISFGGYATTLGVPRNIVFGYIHLHGDSDETRVLRTVT
jgi:hypothetical protein